MRRCGVLGGSFNPVHRGHLFAARLALEEADLEEVVFVPAARPPHKPDGDLAPALDRLTMLQAALEGESDMFLSEVELRVGGPRYTVETLSTLSEESPDSRFIFVLGMDSLRDLPGWKDPERILGEHGVIAIDRPGLPSVDLDPLWKDRVKAVSGNPFAISSTVIRQRVAAGKPIRHLVNREVEAYILERGLYRSGN
jgi:nicotinate-nucleotide adenylyltransferase